MSDQELTELRAFIGEVCGIREPKECPSCHLYKGQGHSGFCTYIPDYCNDLNAMAAAEQTLSPQERRVYALRLQDAHGDLGAILATALQRADAFRAVKESTAKTP